MGFSFRDLTSLPEKKTFFISVTICILLLGAFIRFYGITSEVFWFDEIQSLRNAEADAISGLINRVLMTENTPPAYFVILRFWRMISDAPIWARVFSALVSIACIGMVGLFAKMIAGRKLALVSMILMAVSQYQIYYAHEARVYALLMLTCLSSWTLLLASCRISGKISLRVAYALVTVFGVHLHHCFWFCLFSQFVWAVHLMVQNEKFRRSNLRFLVISGLLILFAALPLFYVFFSQDSMARTSWIPPMNWEHMKRIWRSISLGIFMPMQPWAAFVGGVACAIGLISYCFSKPFRSWGGSALMCAAFVPAALMIGISYSKPLVFFGQRYFCVLHPFLILTLAAGLLALPKRSGLLFLAAICLVWLISVQNSLDYVQKRRYDFAAETIKGRARENDWIIVEPSYSYQCLEFFRTDLPPAITCAPEEWDGRLKEILNAGGRVWLVTIVPEDIYQDKLMLAYAKRNFFMEAPNGPYLRISRYKVYPNL